MPAEHSVELSLEFWEEFFYSTSIQIPQGTDSTSCFLHDILNMYCMGGEL